MTKKKAQYSIPKIFQYRMLINQRQREKFKVSVKIGSDRAGILVR